VINNSLAKIIFVHKKRLSVPFSVGGTGSKYISLLPRDDYDYLLWRRLANLLRIGKWIFLEFHCSHFRCL